MKKQLLEEITVECEVPYYVGSWCRSLEDKAKHIEEWAREFEAFVRDHRSQDPVRLTVQRKFVDICSHCCYGWEEDKDGPLCCDAAQKEWEAERAQTTAGISP